MLPLEGAEGDTEHIKYLSFQLVTWNQLKTCQLPWQQQAKTTFGKDKPTSLIYFNCLAKNRTEKKEKQQAYLFTLKSLKSLKISCKAYDKLI